MKGSNSKVMLRKDNKHNFVVFDLLYKRR